MVFHRHWKLALLLSILAYNTNAVDDTNLSSIAGSNAAPDDATRVCVVIRTYCGHGDGLLQGLLHSLQRQHYNR